MHVFDEASRIAGMRTFDLERLDGDSELKRITDFAALLCEAPIALVSFVESDRQWFPARTGLDACQTPRETSFCSHAMQGSDVFIVPDASRHQDFCDNPLVTGEPHIRFYAGAPLISDDGVPLGALCVIDKVPRDGLTATQSMGLQVLAAGIITRLMLQRSSNRSTKKLDEEESKFRVLADTMPQMVWSAQPDGFHDYYNARWYEFTGTPVGSTDGEGWNGMFHPDDQARAWSVWGHSLRTGDPYEIEYRLRNASGDYRWTLGRALPMRDAEGAIIRWFGTCTDIHDQKAAQVQRETVAQELSHRIKNIFSVINGLISFSTRHHPELKDAASDLRNRIMALGRAHDFVRPHSEASRPDKQANNLAGMLNELLAAYVERVSVSGIEIAIDDRSATPLALLFHELATNSAKYGALSASEGAVKIDCTIDGAFAVVQWQETGGPPVSEPANFGFGSKLIELSVVGQMGGTIARDWSAEGLNVDIRIPMDAVNRPAVTAE